MKKLLYISLILMVGCTKPELPLPEVVAKDNIFNVTESSVTNGQSIYFDLPSAGVYTLTMTDKETGQVVSRERFIGQTGENIKKIYTNSLPKGYLYLVLEDVDRNQLKKTKIIVL
jgi:hypothetical protein